MLGGNRKRKPFLRRVPGANYDIYSRYIFLMRLAAGHRVAVRVGRLGGGVHLARHARRERDILLRRLAICVGNDDTERRFIPDPDQPVNTGNSHIPRRRMDGRCRACGECLAVGVRQGITIVGTAKKLGLSEMTFMNTSAGFLEPVAMVPGGVTDGLYASAGWQDLYSRAGDAAPGKFIADYKAKYDQPASMFAMLGYSGADTLVRALEAAGPDLTHESFIAAMETLNYHDELTGADMA